MFQGMRVAHIRIPGVWIRRRQDLNKRGRRAEEKQERGSERMDWAVWSAVGESSKPLLLRAVDPKTPYRKPKQLSIIQQVQSEPATEEKTWEERRDSGDIACMGVRHKGFEFFFPPVNVLSNVLCGVCSSIMQPSVFDLTPQQPWINLGVWG